MRRLERTCCNRLSSTDAAYMSSHCKSGKPVRQCHQSCIFEPLVPNSTLHYYDLLMICCTACQCLSVDRSMTHFEEEMANVTQRWRTDELMIIMLHLPIHVTVLSRIRFIHTLSSAVALFNLHVTTTKLAQLSKQKFVLPQYAVHV